MAERVASGGSHHVLKKRLLCRESLRARRGGVGLDFSHRSADRNREGADRACGRHCHEVGRAMADGAMDLADGVGGGDQRPGLGVDIRLACATRRAEMHGGKRDAKREAGRVTHAQPGETKV